jgi:hypothetical protein
MKICLAATAGAAVAIAIAVTALTNARADSEAIRPGKWQYTVTLRMPDLPQLPSGIKLPKGVQLGAGNMTVIRTSCLKSADPAEALQRLQSEAGAKGHCNIERMDRIGATVRWAMTCGRAEAIVRIDGTAQFEGDRMEGEMTSHANIRGSGAGGGGAPIEASARVTGRYIGPCGGGN